LTSSDAEGDVASTSAASVVTSEGNNRATSDAKQQSGGGGAIGVRQSDILDSLHSIFGAKKKKKAKKVDIGLEEVTMEEMTGRPIKIVEFVKNKNKSEAFFFESNLKSVLESADNCPIAIISIAGPAHDGKTFFLSSLVRYFEHTEGSASSDDNEDFFETIECQWPSMPELDTSGIYLWNVPYKLQSGLADTTTSVFLMNIHQSEDITEEEYTSQLGLASLISSHVMENPFEDVPRSIAEFVDTLQLLESNIIALRPREETLFNDVPVKTIFQTCFWISKDKQRLESLARYYEEQEQEIQVIPVTGKCKDELLDDLDFLDSEDLVQNFRIPGMLNFFGVIPRMKICEQLLLVSDFFNCCKAYVSLFQGGGGGGATISPQNIEKKSAEIVLRSFVSHGALEYQQEMNRKLGKEQVHSVLSLIQHHLKAEKTAKGSFTVNLKYSSSIVQSQEIQAYEQELNFLLFTMFQNVQNENEIKRNEWMEDWRLRLIQIFVNPIAPRFPNDEAFHDETQLRQILSKLITSTLTHFKEKVAKYFDDEDVIKEAHKTKELLEKKLEKLLVENKQRKEAADKKTKELLDLNVQKLAEKIGNQMALEFVTQKLLEPTEDQRKEHILNQVT